MGPVRDLYYWPPERDNYSAETLRGTTPDLDEPKVLHKLSTHSDS